MTAPRQKPGRSEQTVQTPPDFFAAASDRFGPFLTDLACTPENAMSGISITPKENSLSVGCDWRRFTGPCWLNPPYSDIEAWARKCSEQRGHQTIALLVPASVGARWCWDYVLPFAEVHLLAPRLAFVGHEHPYPKDLMLCLYGPAYAPAVKTWRWKASKRK